MALKCSNIKSPYGGAASYLRISDICKSFPEKNDEKVTTVVKLKLYSSRKNCKTGAKCVGQAIVELSGEYNSRSEVYSALKVLEKKKSKIMICGEEIDLTTVTEE